MSPRRPLVVLGLLGAALLPLPHAGATVATHDTICLVTDLPAGVSAPDICVLDPT